MVFLKYGTNTWKCLSFQFGVTRPNQKVREDVGPNEQSMYEVGVCVRAFEGFTSLNLYEVADLDDDAHEEEDAKKVIKIATVSSNGTYSELEPVKCLNERIMNYQEIG